MPVGPNIHIAGPHTLNYLAGRLEVRGVQADGVDLGARAQKLFQVVGPLKDSGRPVK